MIAVHIQHRKTSLSILVFHVLWKSIVQNPHWNKKGLRMRQNRIGWITKKKKKQQNYFCCTQMWRKTKKLERMCIKCCAHERKKNTRKLHMLLKSNASEKKLYGWAHKWSTVFCLYVRALCALGFNKRCANAWPPRAYFSCFFHFSLRFVPDILMFFISFAHASSHRLFDIASHSLLAFFSLFFLQTHLLLFLFLLCSFSCGSSRASFLQL